MKYARKLPNGSTQSVKEHLSNVSKICGDFTGEVFGDRYVGEILGLFHDLGKYKKSFQDKLEGIGDTTHSGEGGCLLLNVVKNKGKVPKYVYPLINSIISHHSGLNDNLHFIERLMNIPFQDIDESIEDFIKDFPDLASKLRTLFSYETPFHKELTKEEISIYTRMLLSCLVDADRIDAMNWEMKSTYVSKPFDTLNVSDILKKGLLPPKSKITKKEMEINKLRDFIFNEVDSKSELDRGFYSISAPTGSGKTLASINFAIKHAKHNKQNRIVYGLPYITIIEQSANKYREIFGEENVLEVQYAYESDDKDYSLLSSNFDSPVVVTTNIQIFNSLFKSKTGDIRKLHNLANSVIILDEVQCIPTEYLSSCMSALEVLVNDYNCTVLLCSATLQNFEKDLIVKQKIIDLIPNSQEIMDAFKKTTLIDEGILSSEALVDKLDAEKCVLCIVNNKKHANEIYQLMRAKSVGSLRKVYHLSTNMHVKHRKKTINDIEEDLKNKEECIVISTQLIEAGIDISFPVVFRALTGADSLLQARGRCNRNGEFGVGFFHVFDCENETYRGFAHLKDTYEETSKIYKKQISLGKDIDEIKFVETYFSNLIARKKSHFAQVYDSLFDINPEIFSGEFKSISQKFEFIEEKGYSVIVNDDAVVEKALKRYSFISQYQLDNKTKQELTLHTIKIYHNDFEQLLRSGLIYKNNDLFVLNKSQYNNETGFYKTGLTVLFV